MRILLIGTVQFSYDVLKELLTLPYDVVGVCTLQQAVHNSDHVDLSQLAEEANIPWRYSPQIHDPDSLDWIQSLQPDVIFCFGWSRLLRRQVLDLAPLGVVGFHPAALPANRGRHPIIWALALGLQETASTFFFMDEGADSGDIISQKVIPILHSDDANSLYLRITNTAIQQIRSWLPALSSKSNTRTPQDQSLANNWRKRGPNDGLIDWRMPAIGIHNLVRALAFPYPGAHMIYQGSMVKVWKSVVTSCSKHNIEPGKIVAITSDGPVVKAGIDAITLLSTEPTIKCKLGDYL
jgi:methionyl-tRNA formyltransferase